MLVIGYAYYLANAKFPYLRFPFSFECMFTGQIKLTPQYLTRNDKNISYTGRHLLRQRNMLINY